MVDAIAPISATAATPATRTENSRSITSEPDNAWVAERQARIDSDFELLRQKMRDERDADDGRSEGDDPGAFDDRHLHKRHEVDASESAAEDPLEGARLSGESERIGTRNFDEDTPFGHREIII